MHDETFAFRGLARFIAVGVAAGVAQAGSGLAMLSAAARRHRTGSMLGGLWLTATGLLGTATFLSCRNGRVHLTEQAIEIRLGWLWNQSIPYSTVAAAVPMTRSARSEERRVGQECRSRW